MVLRAKKVSGISACQPPADSGFRCNSLLEYWSDEMLDKNNKKRIQVFTPILHYSITPKCGSTVLHLG